jgi:hypothetical protein
MLSGQGSATGKPLGLRHVHGGAVPGFDLTFSAPKSASLAWALGGHPVAAEVKAAHADAVRAGLDYLQEVACFTRRGAGDHLFVKGSGFLAAGYVHRSSRAGDPQLHTHVLVANAIAEGHWTRLYHPAIYEHAKASGYVSEAHLRDELSRRLGVRWREEKRREAAQPASLLASAHGEGRIRTGDTTIFSRVLYQLSYLAWARGDRLRRAKASGSGGAGADCIGGWAGVGQRSG